jgi:hypothetical protein
MTTALSLAIQLADEIEKFPLGNCGPSDDPDMQTAYLYGFRDIAKRFVAAVKRIGDPDLSNMLGQLDASPEFITGAYDLRTELFVIIDHLRQAIQNPTYIDDVANNAAFLNTDVLIKRKAIKGARLDTTKLVKMCEELNDAYGRGNYISSVLLLRAIINHVPPVFGASTFSEAVAHQGRSVKAILTRLNEDARPIADLHTHFLMRATEQLPTKNQIEPYKAGFEVLIQEVIVSLRSDEA